MDACTVVLRKCDFFRQSLFFYTDLRSEKVSHIKANASVHVLIYDEESRTQFRFNCVAHVHHQNDLSDAHLSALSSKQKRLYQSSIKPGELCDFSDDGIPLDDETMFSQDPRDNFAVIICNFTKCDALVLGSSHHKRFLFTWNKQVKLLKKDNDMKGKSYVKVTNVVSI